MVKYHKNGIIAQLVEHMPYKHGVIGSSPIGSTKNSRRPLSARVFCAPNRAAEDLYALRLQGARSAPPTCERGAKRVVTGKAREFFKKRRRLAVLSAEIQYYVNSWRGTYSRFYFIIKMNGCSVFIE